MVAICGTPDALGIARFLCRVMCRLGDLRNATGSASSACVLIISRIRSAICDDDVV